MTEITKKDIEEFKRIYKKEYNQNLSEKMAYNIIDGANKYAEILYEQIINDMEQKKYLPLKPLNSLASLLNNNLHRLNLFFLKRLSNRLGNINKKDLTTSESKDSAKAIISPNIISSVIVLNPRNLSHLIFKIKIFLTPSSHY